MRSLGGFVLLAGIGVGLFVYFPAPVDHSTTLEEARRTVATRAAEHGSSQPAASRLPSFTPVADLLTVSAAQPTAPAAAAKIEAASGWQTSTDPNARYKLIVDIQQNLKRVGCYWGRANGAWSRSTREAMREFSTRANASLPIDQPDDLLLSLLKAYEGRACGNTRATTVAAPAVEVLPWKAVTTNEAQPATRLFTPVPTSGQIARTTTSPLPGRMSMGGPRDYSAAIQEPLLPDGASQRQTALSQPDTPSSGAGSYSPPAAKTRPTANKKASKAQRAAPGTPRYNLMLSLGGVY